MRTRRGGALASGVLLAVLAAGCSSSSSSQGVTSTSAAETATTAAGGSETSAADTEATEAPADTGAETTAAPSGAADGGSMIVGLESEPPSLDPAGNTASLSNISVHDALYDSLMRYTLDGSVQPWLAESLTEAEDRLSWTLVVRDGVTFHDGTPLDAEAVRFNLERQRVSAYQSPAVALFTGVEVVDPMTVKISLSQPWVALPNVLADTPGVMASPAAVATDPDALLRNPVGTGPFSFVEWVPGDRIVVAKNDAYWGGAPPLDEIVFKLLPVESSRVAAFEAGELDVMISGIDETAEKEGARGSQVVSPPPTGYTFLFMNQTRPPFDDVRVRQALTTASDRDAITSAYQGQSYADYSWSPFVKDADWWVAPETPLTFDQDATRALLDEYGQPVSFTYLVLAGNQTTEDVSRATVEYYNEAGIDAEIEIVPDLTTYVTRVITGDFDMAGWIGGSFGDPDAITYNLLHSAGRSNYGKFASAEMDALLEAGRVETDPAAREEIYAEVQQLFRTEVPFLVASHGSLYVIANEDVTGLGGTLAFPARTAAFTAS